jgi:hypothetical protein
MKILYDYKCFEREDFKELEKEGIEILEYHQKSAEIMVPVIIVGGLFLKGFLPAFGNKIGSHLGDKVGRDLGEIYDKIKDSLIKAFSKTPNKKMLLVFEEEIEGIYYHIGFEINNTSLLDDFMQDFNSVVEELKDYFKDKEDVIQVGVSFVDKEIKEIYYIDRNKEIYTTSTTSPHSPYST